MKEPSSSIHTYIYSLTQTAETRLNQSSWNIQRQQVENRKKQETVPLKRSARAVTQWGRVVASTASATHQTVRTPDSHGCSPRNDAARRPVLRARDSNGQGQTPPLRPTPTPPPSSCVSAHDALTASCYLVTPHQLVSKLCSLGGLYTRIQPTHSSHNPQPFLQLVKARASVSRRGQRRGTRRLLPQGLMAHGSRRRCTSSFGNLLTEVSYH
ncbi:hypothetical protein CABS01_03895 [Colletotrichum abscissum]|uniref:Uncharacterized protein n=1 Tax=Colletotrichum abscissum TaxID=1671311 RepID=A0A9P9XG24_9PEZI|nr:uncharacterized protein CABS01_03895 [Colletotrichum abscissum]KAI3553781.1 hypothetical protein CABS02_06114 [Colletotrichum abscissum]KAK1475618.1 hypothetical protein CABS01_03895 [Colletotrichum abscissum]